MDDRRDTRIEIYSGWMTEETQELKYIVDG